MTACSPAASTQPASAPQSAATEVPSPTPSPTCTPAILTVDQKVEAYLNGEIDDVGDLSSQELAEFSSRLAEKKNESRGINPIIYNNEKYIDPSNYKLKDYDGHPDMDETIQMYVPIAGKDEQGNLQFEVNSQIVTISGSANVDWNMVISDPNDTRIDWPNTAPMKASGIPEAQDTIDYFGITLHPMIFLGKQVGELKLGGDIGQNLAPLSTLPFYDIETDAVGNPVLARMILTIGFDYNLFEEGGTLDTQSFMGQLPENSYVYQGLQENAVYYLGISPEQTEDYETMKLSLDGYLGIIAGDKSLKVIAGQEINDKDMVLANVNLLIRKTTNTAK
jgi:hypothetical protein